MPGRAISLSNPGSILPQRYRAALRLEQIISIPAGALALTGNYMAISVNSAIAPFNSGTYNYVQTGASKMNALSGPGAGVGTAPIGWGTLSSVYESYRAIRGRLSVQTYTLTPADILRIVLVPLGQPAIVVPSVGAVTLQVMAGQPGSKTVDAGSGYEPKKLTLDFDVAQLIGWTRQQWMDSTPTSVTAAVSNALVANVGLFAQTLSGGVNAAAVSLVITLTLEVEFYNLDNQFD